MARLLASALLLCLLCVPASRAQCKTDAPQVRIEARILEWQISEGSDFDFAVAYKTPKGSGGILRALDLTLAAEPPLPSAASLFLNNLSAGAGSFDVVVEALEKHGRVEALANPSIVLTSRQVPLGELAGKGVRIYKDRDKGIFADEMTGHIHNTQEIPYETTQASGNRLVSFTDYRNSGLTLDVVVQHVAADGLVVLDVNTRVKDLSGFVRVGLNESNEPLRVPTFDAREIQNRLIVPDRCAFLAGLMKTTREVERGREFPFLSEFPPFCWLKNRSHQQQETELVFMIQPEIIRSETLVALVSPAQGGNGKR